MATRMILRLRLLFFFLLFQSFVPSIYASRAQVEQLLNNAQQKNNFWTRQFRLITDVELMQMQKPGVHLQELVLWDVGGHREDWGGAGYTDTFIKASGRQWRRRTTKEKPVRVWQAEAALEMWQLISLKSVPFPDQRAFRLSKHAPKGLDCIEPIQEGETQVKWCFDNSNLLTYAEEYGMRFTYSNFSTFKESPYPRAITVSNRAGDLLRMSLSAEPVPVLGADTFKIPDDAKPDELTETCVPGVDPPIKNGMLVERSEPVYPAAAKAQRLSGNVVLHGLIAKDGSVQTLSAIDSPGDSLTQASIAAVKKWRYMPYLFCGKPVEVETVIVLRFRIQ